MGQLRIKLPPFEADYSGACAILFPYSSMIIIHDANGCTSNYAGYDEPRWYGSKKMVYCSALRKIDIATGNEERYIARIVKAALDMKPEFIALVGSPVPLVMGTDFQGLALEVEERTGIPCLGIATDGTGCYQGGIALAGKLLLDRFLPEDRTPCPSSYNLLGATPIDYPSSLLQSLEKDLLEKKWNLLGILSDASYDMSLEKLKEMRHASINVALNESGRELAQWFEKYYGIPYITGFPIGEKQTEYFVQKMDLLSGSVNAAKASHAVCPSLEKGNVYLGNSGEKAPGALRGLIVHEAVIGRSLALALEEKSSKIQWDVVSPFPAPFSDQTPGVRYFPEEKDLLKTLRSGYDAVIADPLILNCIPQDELRTFPLAHYAVSSHFMQDLAWGARDDEFINSILERLL